VLISERFVFFVFFQVNVFMGWWPRLPVVQLLMVVRNYLKKSGAGFTGIAVRKSTGQKSYRRIALTLQPDGIFFSHHRAGGQ
jgi:hypothetical protein